MVLLAPPGPVRTATIPEARRADHDLLVVVSEPAAVAARRRGRHRQPLTRRVWRWVLTAVTVAAVAGFAVVAVGPRLFPYRTLTLLSGSMRPGMPTGSMLVDTAEPVSALRAGQVISFHAPVAGAPVMSHRVIQVLRRDGATLIRTKGDANRAPDPWLAVVHGDTVWRVRLVVPGAGHVIRMLRERPVHLAIAWVAPAVLLGWLLAGLWRRRPAG